MLEKETYSQLFKWSFSKKTQVTYWDGTVKEYGQGSGDPVFKIVFNEKIPVKDLLNNASLTLGEAYMDRKIEIEGDIQALIYDVYNQRIAFYTMLNLLNGFLKKVIQKNVRKRIFTAITI